MRTNKNNSCQQFSLWNPVTLNDAKILESVDFPILFADGKNVLTAKAKANIVDFQLRNESSATVIDPIA